MNRALPRIRLMAPNAGRKLARLASEKRIAVRHRGNLRVVAGRVVRI